MPCVEPEIIWDSIKTEARALADCSPSWGTVFPHFC